MRLCKVAGRFLGCGDGRSGNVQAFRWQFFSISSIVAANNSNFKNTYIFFWTRYLILVLILKNKYIQVHEVRSSTEYLASSIKYFDK